MSRSVPIALVALLLMSAPMAQAGALAPPTPPQNVQVAGVPEGTKVTWDPPAYDGGAPVTYRVYRDGALLADGLAATEFIDAALAASAATSSSYFVTAVNDAGESAPGASGGTCLATEAPYVSPFGCVDMAIGLALWAIDQIMKTVENPPVI